MLLLNDVTKIESIRVVPQRNEEVEGLGTGQILRAELTDPLTTVEITTPPMTFDEGRRLRAILNDLDRVNSYFRVYDPSTPFAQNDPTGTLLTSVTFAGKTGQRATFSGQPSGFVFMPGDAFHAIAAGRHYYFEISEQSAVSVRTTPTVPASLPVGTPCVFIRPQIRVQMVPGELQHGTADSSRWGMTGTQIKAIQKI